MKGRREERGGEERGGEGQSSSPPAVTIKGKTTPTAGEVKTYDKRH